MERELPNYGKKKHMDPLQACVRVPLPTPSWPMMSACFLSTGRKE